MASTVLTSELALRLIGRANDLLAEVHAHLDYHTDEDMQEAHDELSAVLSEAEKALEAKPTIPVDVAAALKDALDSLEYVQRAHPEATGWGVRAERIEAIKSVLRKHWPAAVDSPGPALCLNCVPSGRCMKKQAMCAFTAQAEGRINRAR